MYLFHNNVIQICIVWNMTAVCYEKSTLGRKKRIRRVNWGGEKGAEIGNMLTRIRICSKQKQQALMHG